MLFRIVQDSEAAEIQYYDQSLYTPTVPTVLNRSGTAAKRLDAEIRKCTGSVFQTIPVSELLLNFAGFHRSRPGLRRV